MVLALWGIFLFVAVGIGGGAWIWCLYFGVGLGFVEVVEFVGDVLADFAEVVFGGLEL